MESAGQHVRGRIITMAPISNFRLWCQRLWLENREERLLHKDDELRLEEYIKKYKWWLKREYKHQTKRSECRRIL